MDNLWSLGPKGRLPKQEFVLNKKNATIQSSMTQSERWQARYDEVVAFMEKNHRRPSKYAAEERLMWNWMRRNMKLMTRGELPAGRMQKFSLLLELADKYRRVNQYA